MITDPTPTREQLRAATTAARSVYIEAAPGSGKTMVAAERFGVTRFTRRPDERAVLALSFTRAAVAELRIRIDRRWGSAALTWPHRVSTFDAFLYDLLGYLLRQGLLCWPGGHLALNVADGWSSWGLPYRFANVTPEFGIVRDTVTYDGNEPFGSHLDAGRCTHTEIRAVMLEALAQPHLRAALAAYLRVSVRALIVDEIFDGNELDLLMVDLACGQGIAVTVIGDPWQALYDFRGATPALVPGLVQSRGFAPYPLARSFRFRSPATQDLSNRLRQGLPVTVPRLSGDQPLDVVLAHTWSDLWALGARFLPQSFGKPSTPVKAVATLLLNRLMLNTSGYPVIFLGEALNTLSLTAEGAADLGENLAAVLQLLRMQDTGLVEAAADLLLAAVQGAGSRVQLPRSSQLKSYLRDLQLRLVSSSDALIPGLTIHQAKGREWDIVGVRPAVRDLQALSVGIRCEAADHRSLYVALTRGRQATLIV